VRGLSKDGHLRFRYLAQAKALTDGLHQRDPKIHPIAWIHAGNEKGGGPIDLRSAKVRHTMAVEASWLVKEAGFDGVQWDYEICPDDDQDFLKLLLEARAALPNGSYLGADVPGWYPPPLSSFGWSEDYYRQVASRCDGVVVMAYDSGMPTPRAYAWWVSQQTIRITKAAAEGNPICHVLIGVPTYKNSTLSHIASVENLRLALVGVRDGLADGADLSVWQGVSIFADYTTSDQDWLTFDQLWPKGEKHQ